MGRNLLSGRLGDKIDALMALCGFNLKKLLRHLKSFLCLALERLHMAVETSNYRKMAKKIIGTVRHVGRRWTFSVTTIIADAPSFHRVFMLD